MRILHLIHDNKFFGFVNEVFSGLPEVENRFVAFAPGDAPTAHLESLKLWRRVGPDYFRSSSADADLAWCDCLVVHFLNIFGARLMLRAPARVATTWSGWGGDYLSLLPDTGRTLLSRETLSLLQDIRNRRNRRSLRESVRDTADWIVGRLRDRPLLRAAAARADFFSAPLRQEFGPLRSALGPRFRARYAQLDCQSLEHAFAAGPAELTGNDILLGNSATPTNNHVEVLRQLAGCELGDRRVVAPLSYGDADYRDAILRLGKQLLGDRFHPLLAFMPLADYNLEVARCSVLVMNHRRQQALGNIMTALYRGARLFLDETGVMYRYLRELGLQVGSTRQIGAAGSDWLEPLPPPQREQNRAALASIWSRKTVMRNAAAFVAAVRERR